MKTNLIVTLSTLLILSIAGNIYLYFSKTKWEDAWLNQFLATEEIEQILKNSESDLSFENILRISSKRYGSEAKSIKISAPYTDLGADKEAVLVNNTILLFKNGQYYGSKANLPNH